MFEKSLYDLIRGLRNHKGNEREYIQHSLRECRKEIKGADMDLKATALLKLIYLEMFGHDMSWASFHVLEVMSSQKYLQKRVGYLAAVQTFRPDTDVLMLATNLLKKDVSSPLPPTISLPLVALPHMITASLALSLLADLLPRLSHSNPYIRKKTIAALYRLALVYPDALKPAWPKIKDLLLDDEQDPSVTAAVVNVVCELGWRRPKDFLPLAPRLFELLVEGGNNWMAIKIIKLFASLTPLEPRLIKKLLPPLTNLIQTTPAMSLLYECINGVIQGGILEGTDGAPEGEEIASLCVTKLRSMIELDGDPNCWFSPTLQKYYSDFTLVKYVALLAFNRIVGSHPHLVTMQEDVIISCINDPDVSIRLKALDLGARMVNNENLIPLVERLVQQLRIVPTSDDIADDSRDGSIGVEPAADSEGEDPEEILRSGHKIKAEQQALPGEYRTIMIRQIIDICSRDTYANIIDFEWYIQILLNLTQLAPSGPIVNEMLTYAGDDKIPAPLYEDVFSDIGQELRNVAVRVSTVRVNAVKAADMLLARSRGFPSSGPYSVVSSAVLGSAAWIVGEYANDCTYTRSTLDSLLNTDVNSLSPHVICAYLQAIPKVFSQIISEPSSAWNAERRTMTSLLATRVIYFLQPLTNHPDLDVQERAVQFLEIMRIGSQAVNSEDADPDQEPSILTIALPHLFSDEELRPVAPTAQRRVPTPAGLDLTIHINPKLRETLQGADQSHSTTSEIADFERFYNQRPPQKALGIAASDMLPSFENQYSMYQQSEESATDTDTILRKRQEQHQRYRDDPFYIGGLEASSGSSTPFHDVFRDSNGVGVDVDSIPIMDLNVGLQQSILSRPDAEKHKKRRPKKVNVVQDMTIEHKDSASRQDFTTHMAWIRHEANTTKDRKQRSLLEVDSSGLGSLSLNEKGASLDPIDSIEGEAEDLEMAKALAEVERLRLEMQRASERVRAADGAPAEGTLIKVRKRKQPKRSKDSEKTLQTPLAGVEHIVVKKRKKKRPANLGNEDAVREGVR